MPENGPLYADLAGARDATRRLLDHLDELPAADLRQPSLLPGWSRAHVVAHLAGNAQSHVRMLDGCLAGEVREQYEGGREARAAAIEDLAGDPAAAVEEHRRACAELEQRWDAMTAERWERPVLRLGRGQRAAVGLAWARWREVEVHRVDLGAGYGPRDWEPQFAQRLLAELLRRTDLPPMVIDAGSVSVGSEGPRVSGTVAAVAAWLSGRSDGSDLQVEGGPLPDLPPWA